MGAGVKIQVSDDYRIESDSHCWMVQVNKGIRKDTTEVYWKPITFHVDFESALTSLAQHQIRRIADDATAEKIKRTLKVIKDEAREALRIFNSDK